MSNLKLSFNCEITKAQWNEIRNHSCSIIKNQGTIGGRLTYSFTSTGVGLVTEVQCACGWKENLTNYEDW